MYFAFILGFLLITGVFVTVLKQMGTTTYASGAPQRQRARK